MKKIFAAALFTTITASAFAQSRDVSMVKLRFTDNSPIAVNMDGTYFDDKSSTVVIDNVTGGSHTFLVYRANGANTPRGMRPPIVKEMTLRIEPNTAMTYSINLSDGTLNTSRENYTGPATQGRNNGNNDDRYNSRNNGGRNDQRDNDDRTANNGNNDDRNNGRNYGGGRNDQRNDDQYDDRDDRGGNMNNNNGRNDADDDRGGRDDRRGGGRGYYGGRGHHGRHHGRGNDRNEEQDMPEYVMLEATDITAIKVKAQKKVKDADRATVIKNEIGDRGFTTEQARTMLRWMKGETARLEFAKWAYQNVSDVENFLKLKTEFKLAKSKKDLDNLSTGDY